MDIIQSPDVKIHLNHSQLVENWYEWKISNLDFISCLNQIAGRSYNDLSQYPFAPWILNEYSDPKINLEKTQT